MSASSTPKGTPVQRSPSDGMPEDIQSPQHSTPGSGAQQKKRISSLLQSPVRGVFTLMMLLSVSSPTAQKPYILEQWGDVKATGSIWLHALGPVVLRISSSFDWPLSQEYVCFCVQSFREELDVLIQEQMKKGGSSSNLWALRQLADFMATHGSPAALPVSPSSK